MSNDAEVRAREILAHEFSKRGQLSVALAIRRGNLNEDGPYAPAVAAMLAFAAEARSHDGECSTCHLTDISLERTCHNSDCAEYAQPITIYEGWKVSAVPLDEGRG